MFSFTLNCLSFIPSFDKEVKGALSRYLALSRYCFVSPVATDGMDGNGLKLEKICQIFQVLMLRAPKILKKFIMVNPL